MENYIRLLPETCTAVRRKIQNRSRTAQSVDSMRVGPAVPAEIQRVRDERRRRLREGQLAEAQAAEAAAELVHSEPVREGAPAGAEPPPGMGPARADLASNPGSGSDSDSDSDSGFGPQLPGDQDVDEAEREAIGRLESRAIESERPHDSSNLGSDRNQWLAQALGYKGPLEPETRPVLAKVPEPDEPDPIESQESQEPQEPQEPQESLLSRHMANRQAKNAKEFDWNRDMKSTSVEKIIGSNSIASRFKKGAK